MINKSTRMRELLRIIDSECCFTYIHIITVYNTLSNTFDIRMYYVT